MSGQSGELDSENLVLVTFDLKKKIIVGQLIIRVNHRAWMKFDGIKNFVSRQ